MISSCDLGQMSTRQVHTTAAGIEKQCACALSSKLEQLLVRGITRYLEPMSIEWNQLRSLIQLAIQDERTS